MREYLVDFNGAQAAIRAGYSAHAAKAIACKLLTFADVRAAIDEARVERIERLDVSVDDIVREYLRIGMARVSDFITWGPNGVRLKASNELTDSALAAILEVSETGTGKDRRVSFRLHSKTTALRALGKHLGMGSDAFNARVQREVESLIDAVRERMTSDAAAQLTNAIRAEMGFEEVATPAGPGPGGGPVH